MTLNTIQPPIWRSVRVSRNCNFQQLHTIVQKCFGWTGIYDHKFEGHLGQQKITIMPLLGIDYGDDAVEETAIRLREVFRLAREKGELF